jgi:hypothetical protein
MVEQMNADREASVSSSSKCSADGHRRRADSSGGGSRENGFNDKQLTRVHELSGAFGGNLLQAADVFRAIRQEALEDFVAQKAAVDPGVGALRARATRP